MERADARGSILSGVGATRGNAGPIRLGEFHAPEVGRRRQELDADSLAFARILAQVNDAALLFLLREGIGDDKFRIVIDRVRENEKGAVSADDDGLAGFAEALAVVVLAGHDHFQPHKDT